MWVVLIGVILLAGFVAIDYVPNFRMLEVGRCYRDRANNYVTIREKILVGEHELFVAHNDVRYFSDGCRVNDIFKNSKLKLFKRIR